MKRSILALILLALATTAAAQQSTVYLYDKAAIDAQHNAAAYNAGRALRGIFNRGKRQAAEDAAIQQQKAAAMEAQIRADMAAKQACEAGLAEYCR